MNPSDQTLCLSQLAMAATQAKLGESHCQEAAARGAIIGLTEIPKIRLAQIHFREAAKFLQAALQNLEPVGQASVGQASPPVPAGVPPAAAPPTIEDHIALAKQINAVAITNANAMGRTGVSPDPSSFPAPAAPKQHASPSVAEGAVQSTLSCPNNTPEQRNPDPNRDHLSTP